MTTAPISHALVLPDRDFINWYRAADAYTRHFPRVVVVRSPAGNDLNRFRDITAVNAPRTWLNDDAVFHIRRIYPSVVLVDPIDADTPAELEAVLAARIRRDDRYGRTIDNGRHLDERLTIGFPSDHFPARIVQGFDARIDGGRPHEGLDIATARGENILAATDGFVSNVVTTPNISGYGQYVVMQSTFDGRSYFLTYTHLGSIQVTRGQQLGAGDVIGTAAGTAFKLVMQAPGRGRRGYRLPDVIDPTPLLHWDGLRLRTTVDGLRVRSRPGLGFSAVGQVYLSDSLVPLETHGRTLLKIGREGEWLRVRTPTGLEGFCAAWLLTASAIEIPEGLNITGVNLDITEAEGRPAPEAMRGIGWTRFTYDVSRGTGALDLNAAERLFRPYIERYANAGQRPIVILNHQTFGETRYNWEQMTPDLWAQHRVQFVQICREIARTYAGENIIGAYQIWNEQDTPPTLGRAAVPMPAHEYGRLLAETIRALRASDPNVTIITGGLVSGPDNGANYINTAFLNMPSDVRPDGVAFHAYGLAAPDSPPQFRIFGSIGRAVLTYSRVLDAPVWITEWGVLDMPTESAQAVADYATSFIGNLKRFYPDRVAAAVWFAWADGQDNGYGLVSASGQPKQPLYDAFLRA